MREVVIVDIARSAIGTMGGSLKMSNPSIWYPRWRGQWLIAIRLK